MVLIDETKAKKHKESSTITAILDESNLINEHEMKNKKLKVKSSVGDIIPVIDFTNNDFFEMRNGEYMEILQLTSKDIYSLNESDKDNDIFSLAYFFQAYLPDIKFVPLNTPMNLDTQKEHIYRQIKKNKIPAYLSFLEKKLYELEFLESNRTNREYFIFIYADDEKTLLERKQHVKKLLMRSNPIIELELNKKISVLRQLNNPNSKPITD
ncbi:MAG: hypothetical protein ACI35O_16480 [Bacillaceae bacterium]